MAVALTSRGSSRGTMVRTSRWCPRSREWTCATIANPRSSSSTAVSQSKKPQPRSSRANVSASSHSSGGTSTVSMPKASSLRTSSPNRRVHATASSIVIAQPRNDGVIGVAAHGRRLGEPPQPAAQPPRPILRRLAGLSWLLVLRPGPFPGSGPFLGGLPGLGRLLRDRIPGRLANLLGRRKHLGRFPCRFFPGGPANLPPPREGLGPFLVG